MQYGFWEGGSLESVYSAGLVKSVKAFNNKTRQGIMSMLLLEGEMSIREISTEMNVSMDTFYYHAAILVKANLIKNNIRRYGGVKGITSNYVLTDYGETFLKSITAPFDQSFQ